jgi:hypothetical protein
MQIRGEDKKRNYYLIISSLFAFIVQFVVVYAQSQILQDIVTPVKAVGTVISQGKFWPFIAAWAAATFLIFRWITFVIELVKQKSPGMEGGKGGGSWIIWIIAAATTVGTVASTLSTMDKTTFSWLAWITFIILFAVVEVLSSRILKGEKDEEAYIIAGSVSYYLVSVFIAPFFSILAGKEGRMLGGTDTGIFGILLVHLIIGFILYSALNALRAEKEERKKGKEEEKIQKKLIDEREYNKKIREEMWEHEKDMMDKRIEFEKLNKQTIPIIQQMGATQPGNVAAMYPLLVKIMNGLPEKESVVVGWASRKEEIQRQIDEATKAIRAREELIQKYKDEYAATKPGLEIIYIIGLIRKLTSGDAQRNWVALVSNDNGNTWTDDSYIKKFDEWKNKGYEHLEKELREKLSDYGKEDAVSVLRKRLKELALKRAEVIKKTRRDLESLNDVTPRLIEGLEEQLKEEDAIIKESTWYTKTNEEMNSNLETLKKAIRRAADANTSEAERHTLTTVTISTLFSRLIKNLGELLNHEENYRTLVNKQIITIDKIRNTEKKLEKIRAYQTIFEEEYGTIGVAA